MKRGWPPASWLITNHGGGKFTWGCFISNIWPMQKVKPSMCLSWCEVSSLKDDGLVCFQNSDRSCLWLEKTSDLWPSLTWWIDSRTGRAECFQTQEPNQKQPMTPESRQYYLSEKYWIVSKSCTFWRLLRVGVYNLLAGCYCRKCKQRKQSFPPQTCHYM